MFVAVGGVIVGEWCWEDSLVREWDCAVEVKALIVEELVDEEDWGVVVDC